MNTNKSISEMRREVDKELKNNYPFEDFTNNQEEYDMGISDEDIVYIKDDEKSVFFTDHEIKDKMKEIVYLLQFIPTSLDVGMARSEKSECFNVLVEDIIKNTNVIDTSAEQDGLPYDCILYKKHKISVKMMKTYPFPRFHKKNKYKFTHPKDIMLKNSLGRKGQRIVGDEFDYLLIIIPNIGLYLFSMKVVKKYLENQERGGYDESGQIKLRIFSLDSASEIIYLTKQDKNIFKEKYHGVDQRNLDHKFFLNRKKAFTAWGEQLKHGQD